MSILEEISELNERFESLLNDARLNEKTLKKFQSFEIALINSDSPAEFFNTLLEQSREDFGWDEVTVALVDQDHGIRRLLTHSGDVLEENSEIIFLEDPAALSGIYNNSSGPLLGLFDPGSHELLFPGAIEAPASMALLPLLHKHKLAGSFNIGSLDEHRFSRNVATDFLRHLAAIITVCIDNILSREHLKYLGLVDNLTGVNNRRFFEQRVKEEVTRVQRTRAPMSCLFIDADHFKRINDTWGHAIGDQVLRHIAQVIREQVRTIDIVVRYGGEEFTVILLQTARDRALEVAERIRTRIEHDAFIADDGRSIRLSVSIGIDTLMPEDCNGEIREVIEALLTRADEALYAAKNQGRNRTVCYADARLQ